MLNKYEVEIYRKSIGVKVFSVTANNEEEAKEKADKIAKDTVFSEYRSEYHAGDIKFLEKSDD